MTFLIGILAGLGIAMMSAINERLRRHLDALFLTACVSFSVGLAMIMLIALLGSDGLVFERVRLAAVPWWAWCGGLLGVMSLSAAVLTFPKLGAVQAAVMAILGQVSAGLLVDSFGWLGAPYTPFSGSRFLGLSLVLAGIWVAVVLPAKNTIFGGQGGGRLWLWRALGVFGGACNAVQAAVNGKLGQVLDSPVSATVVSFLVGALGLWTLVLVYEKSIKSLAKPMQDKPFWIWLGGAVSALFIYASIWLVPQIGTGSAVLLLLTGSIFGSLLVDRFGLFGVDKKPVKAMQMGGAALLLAGVACIRLI